MPDGSTIGLVLSSSVFAAVFSQGVPIVRDYFIKGKSANYSALYLAMALEAYGRACSECISQSDMYDASDGAAGSPQRYLPSMPPLPDTIDWKALGIDITAEAMALPILVDTTNVSIAATWDVTEEEQAVAAVREAAAKIGIEAFSLAKSVRQIRKIPALKQDEEWNALTHLEKRQAEFAERDRLNGEAQRGLFETRRDLQED